MKQSIVIIAGSGHGQYIPQVAAEMLAERWSISAEDKAILLAGPDHDLYCDTWDHVESTATFTDEQGNIWNLYQDGDLFAVCEALMTEQEKADLFGEE